MTVRQAALAAALDSNSRSPSPIAAPTHVAEQAALRDETIAVFHKAVLNDSDDEDDLLVERTKTRDELEREEEEYKAFLEREVGEDLRVGLDGLVNNKDRVNEDASVSEKKKKKKSKKAGQDEGSKEKADQEFLEKYVLFHGFSLFIWSHMSLAATSSTVAG